MTAGLRVAVADDERDVREYLQEVLPRLGHEVVAVAETGRQLVERCRAAHPDLIIADIRMPDGDGIEAAETIDREHPVAVLLVSAHHDADLVERASSDHVMGYLIKPIKEADLRAAIPVAVGRFRHMQELAQESADLRQALEDRKLIEKAKGIVMKRLHLSEEEAFRRLRKLASNQNRKLVEVARLVASAEEIFHQLDHT
jgi:response regulator NasT